MRKSRFLVFILSFIPGLSNLYVGCKERAIIFFGLFFGTIFGVVGMSMITNSNDFLMILALGLPIIWFAALVDAFSFVNRARNDEGELLLDQVKTGSNRKLITVALSVVPGAGHMYLGLMQQGMQLMAAFFFTAFLMSWLHLSLLLFILPVIWFYGIFDALHRVEGEQEEVLLDSLTDSGIFGWIGTHPRLVGWGLILLGCFAIFDRIISPFLSWEIKNYLQTGIVSFILIFSGIKLLIGSKTMVEEEEIEECADGE